MIKLKSLAALAAIVGMTTLLAGQAIADTADASALPRFTRSPDLCLFHRLRR